MNMLIKREYNHRTFGLIGSVALEAEVAAVKIDGKLIPDDSVEYLLNFALQSLQDAYAGAKTTAEAKASWAKKLDAIIAGSVGVRSGGTSVSEEVRIGRSIMREQLRKANKAKWTEVKEMDDDKANAYIDALVAKNAKVITPLVVEEMERLRTERAKKAAMSKSMTFEL